MQIRLKTLRRRARLLFLPAYVADYNFGKQFNEHGERRPQRFQAVVSGMDPSSIAAERHYSPHKVPYFSKGAKFLCCGVLNIVPHVLSRQAHSVSTAQSTDDLAFALACMLQAQPKQCAPLYILMIWPTPRLFSVQ